MTMTAAALALSPEAAELYRELEVLRAEELRRARRDMEAVWFEHACRWETDGAFASFVKLMWPTVEPAALEWAPYMDVVCHALHRQMLGDRAYRRLLINLPPGAAKSLLGSVMAPAFEWLFRPSERKLFFTADDDLSARDSRRTRIVLTSPEYQALLAEVCKRAGRKPWEMAYDQNEKRNFENTAKGFRQCMTLKTGITGKRGDSLIIDDPIDVKAVILGGPEAANERCEESGRIISQALSTRVNDRRNARLTLIMQRLHPRDPAGVAIARGGWKVMCLPMRYEPDHPQVCPEDPRTVAGEFLHPGRDTEEGIAELETELGWQAPGQLQMRPVAGQSLAILPEHLAREYHADPREIAALALEVWGSVDANQKGGAGRCDTTIHIWAKLPDGFYLLDRIARPMGIVEFDRTLDGMIEAWAPVLAVKGGCMIEDAANGTSYLETRAGQYKGVTLRAFRPSRDTPGADKSKAARGQYVVKAAAAQRIVLPSPTVAPWVLQYRERLLGWPAVGADDMDAASQRIMLWQVEGAFVVDMSEWEGISLAV